MSVERAWEVRRGHGAALIVLALGNAVMSFLATKTPIEGPFRFLLQNPAVPLLALFTFQPLVVSFMGPHTVLASAGIHGTFITLETVALLLQWARPAARVTSSAGAAS